MPEDKYRPPPEYYELTTRYELNGHLWNDWAGVAGEMVYALKPTNTPGYKTQSAESTRKIQGRQVHATIEKIETARLIPKVDLSSLPEDRKASGIRYNELANKTDALYKRILEASKDLTVDPQFDQYAYVIPDGHPILGLLTELKEIMVEVNELLYEKPCEYFG